MLRLISASTAACILVLATAAQPGAQAPAAQDRVVAVIHLAGQAVGRVLAEEATSAAADALAGEPSPFERDRRRSRAAVALMARLAAVTRPQRDHIATVVQQRGGRVLYSLPTSNAVVARVSRDELEALRARPDVARVIVDEPRHALIELAGETLKVSAFWNGGYRGGAVDVAVIDTGLYAGHVAFASRAASLLNGVFHASARQMSNYADSPSDPTDLNGHGTSVSGVVFSQGDPTFQARKGMAPGIDRLFNIKSGYLTSTGGGSSMLTDLMAGVDWALQNSDPPEVFNYSYGGPAAGDDDDYARFWDAIVDGFGKTATIAAGNSGANALNTPGNAYNVLSVASSDPLGTPDRDDDQIASSSSGGPSVGGRKKPDVAAPGRSLWMPGHYGPLVWRQASGTSFAAPTVAGVAALLIDSGVADPRAVKAVLINSADHRFGNGWDPRWGWGYLNAERAHAQRGAVLMATLAPSPGSSRVRLFEREASAPTKATAVWHRHVSYQYNGWPSSGDPLRNVDLLLYSRASGALRLGSTSTVDNVEQVTHSTGEGVVLALVAAEPFAPGAETVALAHSGDFVPRSGPAVSVTMGSLAAARPGSTFTVPADVSNPGDLRGHGYTATLSLPGGYTLVQGQHTQAVGSLDAGARARVSWLVRAPAAPQGPARLSVSAAAAAYGLTWQAATEQTMVTEAGCGFEVHPTSLELPRSGGSASITVTVADNCPPWAASSADQWLTVSPAEGTRSGSVTVTAGQHYGAPHTGTVVVAGQPVSVTQYGLPPRTYYLAEGSTVSIFTLDLAIANPHEEPADILVRFLRSQGAPVERRYRIEPKSRLTIPVNELEELRSADVSIVVESLSGLALAVERTMSWDATGYGGHGGTAVEALSPTWFFAEGAQGYFDTYLLLANPGSAPASVTVSYLRAGRDRVVRQHVVPPAARVTLYAGDDEALIGQEFSIAVVANQPIIAERAMYWSRPGMFWAGGHESAGVAAPDTSWFLAEGATGPYFDDYVMVGNPNDVAALVNFTWLLPSGETIESVRTIAANGRLTVEVEREHPALRDVAVSAAVVATQPVVVERSMYWPGSSAEWTEAHNAFGVTGLGRRWALAEGRVGFSARYETYVLLANPGPTPATVRMTALREAGTPVVKTFTVEPRSRFNVVITPGQGNDFPELANERFGVLIEVVQGDGIAVERAMYWNSGAVAWAAGTNAVGTRIP